MNKCEHKVTNIVQQDKLVVCNDCGYIVMELDNERLEILNKIWDLVDGLNMEYKKQDILLCFNRVMNGEYFSDLKKMKIDIDYTCRRKLN